jgi:hypothetical protein
MIQREARHLIYAPNIVIKYFKNIVAIIGQDPANIEHNANSVKFLNAAQYLGTHGDR